MLLKYANYICPKCKSGNYMRWPGQLSKEYDVKCINCNSYFTTEELQVRRTNGDNLRTMSDEELAGIIKHPCDIGNHIPTEWCANRNCGYQCSLDWLRKEATDEH